MKVWSDADMYATADAIATLGEGNLLHLLKPPLIGLQTLLGRASRNADLMRRIRLAKSVRKQRLSEQADDRYAAALIDVLPLIRSGATVADACRNNPHSPDPTVIFGLLKKRPELKLKLDQAVADREAMKVANRLPPLSDDQIERIMAAVSNGALIKEAFAATSNRSSSELRVFLRSRPDLKARLNTAVAEREASNRARGRQAVVEKRTWSDADYDAALDAIRNHRGRSIHDVLGNNLPTYNGIWDRSRRSVGFAERFRDAIGEQMAWRRTTYAKQPKRIYQQETLRRGLNENELYREASKLFHRGMDPDLRDDLISNVVTAVLAGELPRDELAVRGAAVGWHHHRKLNGRQMDTLDRPAYDNAKISLLDTITGDQWSFEGAI